MRVITVSRQFGSGGRELGKRLADALGFKYYDKHIIEAAAEEAKKGGTYTDSMAASTLVSLPLTFARSFSVPLISPAEMAGTLGAQHAAMKELASSGDCVVVGRSGNVVLGDETPFRIFVYADMDSRIARCRGRAKADEADLTDRAYEKKIKRIDKQRTSAHRIVSDIKWGDPLGYDLCINTTGIEIKSIVAQTAEYAKHFFENNGK